MLDEALEKLLNEAKTAREQLRKAPGKFVGRVYRPLVGEYLKNLAQCLLNRQIDVFDDTLLLLEKDRIASACTVSRAMIETHAIANEIGCALEKILTTRTGRDSSENCLERVLKFTNSSRFKETEQKKLSKGIFQLEDFTFTKEAENRMLNSLASSVHIMNALRTLYSEEMAHTGEKESHFELLYDGLSEWVHPSQTSVFHHYTPETHVIPTSEGNIAFHKGAMILCVRALHFITHGSAQKNWLDEIAEEMSRRDSI